MRAVILGCGRVGASLASKLDGRGHQVTIIDTSSDAFRRLGEEFGGEPILGTGIDQEILETAGISDAELFVAVTENDCTNLMASQIAKLIYKVNKVVTRIYDPDREEIFHDLGYTTVCPTRVAARLLRGKVARPLSPAATTSRGAA